MAVTPQSAINYRLAQTSDASSIFHALETVSNEIPLLLDTPERRQAISQRINQCCANNSSWIAVVQNEQVVGFLLVEPDELQRFFNGNGALHIAYAGVTENYRGQRIFPELIARVTATRVPVTATVKHANQSNMTCRLMKLGFERVSPIRNDEDSFLWRPS